MCATPARHRAQRKDTPDCEREFWAARDLVESAGQGRSARHTRKVQSWYAPHIGRVGALAVSLGVGLAIANTAGVAYADTDSESVSSRTESDDDSPSAGPRKSSATAGSEPNEETSSDDESPDEDADDVAEDITEDITEDEEVPDGDAEVEDPGDEGQSPDEEVDSEEAVAPETEPPSGGVSDLPVDSDDAPQAPPLTEPTPTRDVDAIVGTDAESPVDSGDEASDLQIEGDAPTDDGRPQTEMVSLETSTTDDSVALAPAASPTEVGVENVNIVSAMVAGVISPFADPAAPAQVPWFDALMAWVRRQITHTFFNKSPVIGPITTSQIVTGQLLIDLSASDPNGDPLTYTIIQPENGLVIRDPITGTFIYTPTTIVTEPVTDTFQVIVSDDSEHLKGIAGLIQGVFHCVFRAIGLAEPDKVTVTIPVTIDPLVQLPPVVVTVGAPIYALGSDPVQLLSSVVITDVDSTNLSSATVTIATGAQDGDVLEYVAPESNPVVGEWDAETKTLTLTGPGTLAEYREALKAVSFFTTDAGIPRGVLIRVTDDTDVTSPVPGVATIAVIGFPPLVVVSPVALGSAGSPVTVSPVVVITDLDSEELDSATVTLTDPAAGDLFGWGDVPAGVTAGYAGGVLTFTGSASVAEYRDLLASVTLTSSSAGVKLVNFAVVDGDGNASVVPAATVVTVLGLAVEVPPLVIVSPAAAGTTGSPIAVSPIVVVTDLDSEELDSATVTLAGAGAGVDDVFGWGTLPTNVAATVNGGVLTFTGTASVAEYRDLLASVTLTSASAGLKLVSFAVVDGDGNASVVPAATVVTVVGLAVEVPPLVLVSPVAAGAAGSPVTVSPVVVITDLDSEELDSATVTLTDPGGGDSFGWGDVPAGVTAGLVGGVLTFTGTASRSDYQALLESVTLTSSTAGLKLVSFAVVDGDGNASVVPAATVVTVVGLAVEVPPLVIVSPVAAGAAGSPVTVSPIVVITDLDSTELDSATVTLTDPGAGDSFGWGTLPTNVAATVAGGVLTFTGTATRSEYQALLESVRLTSSTAGLKLVSFAVVDGDGNASVVPAATVVTVVGLAVEVPPLVIVSPAAAGAAGSPVTVSPIVVITDLDSEELDSATVTLADPGVGDSFGWGDVPAGVTAGYAGGVLTFTGSASVAEYRDLLASVTLTSSTAGLKLVSFAVVDGDGNASVVPAATVVTVVGLAVEVPPLVIVSPAAAGAAGSPVTVSPVVVITDLDSTELDSATVTLSSPGVGDSFGWGSLPTNVAATVTGGVLTFTGTASVSDYQALLESVTLTSSTAGLKSVSFAVTDADGNASVVPAATVVTVVGLAVEVPPLVIVSPAAAGSTGSPITVSPIVVITDLDSADIESATVTLGSAAAGDSFGWGDVPAGVTAGLVGGVLTFTGSASRSEYQALLESVTLTSSSAGLKVVSFAVVDGDGNASTVPAATVVTVVGLAVEVPPLVIVSPAAAGTTGSPVTVSPIVVITDLDSEELESATVTLTDPGAGDSFGWGTLPTSVAATVTGGVLTFTGSASVAEYRDLLASVTLTSSTAGLKSVSFAVTDADGSASVVPAATVVTVVGLAVEVPPLVIVSPAAAGAAGSPVAVSPVVVITDLDSTELDSATVTLSSSGVGDSFGWGSLPTNVVATVTGGVLTFTGTASVLDYQALLESVTLTSSSAGLKLVSFTVVDGDGNASTVLAATVVTVVGLAVEVPPLVIVSPAAAGVIGSPVTVSPVVVITDLDSEELASATVTLTDPGVGDSFGWGDVPAGVTAGLVGGVLTFTGTATRSEYQALLESVTLTSATAGLKSVTFAVVDGDGNASVVPAATVVTVVGLAIEVPPLVIVSPAAAGTTGSPITVSPVVLITDLDSEELDSATVTLADPGVGDSFGWGDVPAGVTAGLVGGVLTFTGTATRSDYQALLESVTLTSSTVGLKSVTFAVVDGDGNASVVPAATVVTVVGLAVEVPPLVIVSPAAAGATGSPVTVSPIVVITDLDSSQLDSATVTLSSPGVGDSFGWGTLPGTVAANVSGGVLTFTGTASVADYQALLESVTLTSATAGINSVTFTVIDGDGNTSVVPAVTAVTVVGVPGASVAPVLVATPIAAGTTGSPITVSPVVVITDLDSAELESATVTLSGAGIDDVFDWGSLPTNVAATVTGGVVSFTGTASVADYQALLGSVTLTSATAGIKSVTFAVIDGDGNTSVVPAVTAVTVVGVPGASVAPVLVATPIAAGTTGSPITVSPVVVITDLDSAELESATVTLSSPGVGDSFGWGTLPGTVAANVSGGVLTFTGTASVAEYRDLLASVTLTSATAGIKSVTFAVTDSDGNESVVPAITAVTVVGVPGASVAPVLVATPIAAGTTDSAITVSPIVVITDLDSANLQSATVTLSGAGIDDVFDWGTLPTNVAATVTGGVLSFTGNASVADYQALLESVTLTSATAGIKSVTFTVTDSDGNTSVVPTITAVTVVGVPGASVAPVLVATPIAAGTTGSPITVSPIVVITDLDSSQLDSATVTLSNPDVGDSFGWGTLPTNVAATVTGGVVSFTGSASVAEYRDLLASVTLTSATAGIKSVTFTVTDSEGNTSVVPAITAVTVVGVPGASVAPVLVATPIAAGTTGSAFTVSPIVVITDLDSSQLDSATVTLSSPGVGDSFGWGTLPDTVAASVSGGVVSFTGSASVADYRALLESVTLTSATAGLKSVTFAVTDSEGITSVVPAVTAVTVVGVPGASVAPVLVATPIAAGTTGSPITVSPIVVITDLDSSQLDSATVTLSSPGVGDSFGWGSLPTNVVATVTGGVVSFTGSASVADYQALLESVTLTSATAGLKSVTFTVTDGEGNTSVVPAVTAVTVVGVPGASVAPVLVATPIAAGTTGSPITVSPVVVITDLDSSQLDSATVTLSNPGVGDSFGWGTLPTNVTANVSGGVLSFTGTASVAEYRDLLASVTLTSATAGIKSVTFTVTDSDGNTSVAPAVTAVTVVGLPVSAAPIVLTSVVNVSYTAGTTGVAIDPGVIILDGDSTTMTGATVTIIDPQVGDTLVYGPLPTDVTADFDSGVLTFEGTASVSDYQQLLRSVTFSTNSSALATIKTISFTITDDQQGVSSPGLVTVTVLSLPILATPAVVTSVVNVAYTAGDSAIVVDPGLILLDADSTTMSGAVVAIVGGAAAGESLGYTPQAGINGSYNAGVLTFDGVASVAAYQQLLRSVTFSTDSNALATIKSISFVVTDDQDKVSAPALVAVTVVTLPLQIAPLVTTSVVNVSYTAGNSAITVDPLVSVLDLDSTSLEGATVEITGGFAAGDVLSFTAPTGITGAYNSADGVLTLEGTASIALYEQALRSVTLSTGSGAIASLKTVSFSVVDAEGTPSLLPANVVVTVVAAPVNLAPLVVTTALGPIYTAGNTAVDVNPLLTVLDLDSATLTGASVAITGNFASGDLLGFTAVAGISGSYDAATGILTFTGSGTPAQYQQLLRSVTFSTNGTAPAAVKTVTFTVTDPQGATSLPAAALVTVTANSAPILTAPLGGGLVLLGAQVLSSTAVILDDSSYLDRAVVTITNVQSGDSLTFTPTGSITGAYSAGVLTLTGLGTVLEYQTVIQSIRFSKSVLNLLGFRNITMVVRDAQGLISNTTSGTMTLVL
ncbi:hypothetical protein [Mycobacterium sp. DL]|uniref:Ig-like domain-containing protein n=1 Tax=Mycobacterium sp. DL TaxID=3145017 RepID=UPI00321A70DE